MKNIIKTWLKDHEIKIPKERIDLLVTMLKSRENDILQQEKERIIRELYKLKKNRFPEDFSNERQYIDWQSGVTTSIVTIKNLK